ncbi:hypothetical protein pdam_00016656 [Pocillopora damicornis]|uniref:Reverse transcriptase domain-containing protein n=1 Tax=Pocillopora damicornis TaxID=46731 RepID=A0A3M6U8I3_POCDA|nr:hypothetical protein pdam_00016656 [Pocillopora damicornis]
MNDLPDVLQFCQVTQMTLFYISPPNLLWTYKARLILKTYMANQLTLNVKKSKFLPIGSSSCLSKIGSILISADDIPLDNVDSCTYLGIVINNRFSWTDYIDYICGKISKKLGL